MDDAEPTAPEGPAVTAPAPVAPSEAARAKTEKARRLAAALRDNLRRRKAAGRTARTVKPSN